MPEVSPQRNWLGRFARSPWMIPALSMCFVLICATVAWSLMWCYRLELISWVLFGGVALVVYLVVLAGYLKAHSRCTSLIVALWVMGHVIVAVAPLFAMQSSDTLNTVILTRDLTSRVTHLASLDELQAEALRVIEANRTAPELSDAGRLHVEDWKNPDGSAYDGLIRKMYRGNGIEQANYISLWVYPGQANAPYIRIDYGGGFIDPRGVLLGPVELRFTEAQFDRYASLRKVRPGIYLYDERLSPNPDPGN